MSGFKFFPSGRSSYGHANSTGRSGSLFSRGEKTAREETKNPLMSDEESAKIVADYDEARSTVDTARQRFDKKSDALSYFSENTPISTKEFWGIEMERKHDNLLWRSVEREFINLWPILRSHVAKLMDNNMVKGSGMETSEMKDRLEIWDADTFLSLSRAYARAKDIKSTKEEKRDRLMGIRPSPETELLRTICVMQWEFQRIQWEKEEKMRDDATAADGGRDSAREKRGRRKRRSGHKESRESRRSGDEGREE